MIIAQFNTDPVLIELASKHHAWHTPGGSHGFPGRINPAGSAGAGIEFFQFHHDLMNQFLTWNTSHGTPIPASLLVAWTSVPSFLKVAAFGWNTTRSNAENRIKTNSPAFANDDELGIFVESTIHNWIHGATATWLNSDADPSNDDSFIGGFHSPQSSYFYQIHGLMDLYWNRFLHPKPIISDVGVHKRLVKELVKEHIKDIKEFKENVKEIKEKEGKEFGKEFKEKDKDIVEGGGGKHFLEGGGKNFAEGIDPRDPRKMLEDHTVRLMNDRISKMEWQKDNKKLFIRPAQRPNVGKGIRKKRGDNK
ncbi:MAG: hypothetical protein ABR502_06645 [Chitinophagaceae bacterium]